MLDMLKPLEGPVQALILVPTRELALQVADEINSYKNANKMVVYPIYGGQPMSDQIRRLKKGADIVVGTPGRINDHIRRRTLKLDSVSLAVLDEADEMLNMGFIDDIKEILSHTNPDRRTLLFSATMPDHILGIAKEYMKSYTVVSQKKKEKTVTCTEQKYFEISQSDRLESLCRIVDMEDDFYGLIFCRTKVNVDELSKQLQDRGYDAEGIHGDFSQQKRERVLEKFKRTGKGILVATDVAARGIDINDLTHVVNYSLPQDTESYIHRIGRTGRAGRKGTAITFISPSEHRRIAMIVKTTGADIKKETIPAINDIINAKRNRMAVEITEIIEAGEHKAYMEAAVHMLSGHEPLDVIAAMIKQSKKGELDKNKYCEIKLFPARSESYKKPKHGRSQKPFRFAKPAHKKNSPPRKKRSV
jgi:ATP-dependent RNA helicase DeaD